MKYLIIILTLILSACTFHTKVTYGIDKKDDFIREDGFMLSCQKDGDFLIIGTYTPESWGDKFYYDWLKGNKTDRKLKISKVAILFLETNDTLTLKEIRKERDYFFTSPKLKIIIDKNKNLKLTVSILDLSSGRTEIKEYTLTRKKHTYQTGTFPHA